MAKRSKINRGFNLVELMLAVAIVGVLAALAIYGVGKYVANAKTVEARNALGQIAKDVTTAFQRETMAGTILSLGGTATKSNALCPDGNKVPASLAQVAGRKYLSSPAEWIGGWQCLKFSIQDPQYYQYEYQLFATGGGASAGDFFAISAKGDLDSDGKTATFLYEGALVPDGTDLALVLGPNISEWDPDE